MSVCRLLCLVVWLLVGVERGQLQENNNCNDDETAWLEKACTEDSECTVEWAVCFKGKCLCTPGYYYSQSRKTCMTECPRADQQPTFVKYPNSGLFDYAFAARHDTVEQCLERCAEYYRCRSMGYNFEYSMCYLQQPPSHHIEDSWLGDVYNADHYQATCL